MKRLKNYRQDRRVYCAYFGDPDNNQCVELKAQNMGHFLQRLAAQLPNEDPETITVIRLSDHKETDSLFPKEA